MNGSVSEEEFQDKVKKFIENSPENVKKLAREFGTALTTVDRWAKGVSRPHPSLRPFVMLFIEEQSR